MVSYILVYLLIAHYYLQRGRVPITYSHQNANLIRLSKQDRQRTYKRSAEVCSRNHCCHVKAISITNSERMSVALCIHHTQRFGCSILSYVACLAVPYFGTWLPKWYNFQGKKKKLLTIKCVFDFVYNFCLKNSSF
jgi:hypothetical protein